MANSLAAWISAKMPTCICGALPASLRLEMACFVAVRSKTFHAMTFCASLAATNLFVVLLPLFVTNTASYGAAEKACYDRTFSRLNTIYLDENSPRYNPDWDMHDNADRHLFPLHLFNSLSTAVSLFGFGVWVFFSPHQSDVAKDLDRTRELRPLIVCCCIVCFGFWFPLLLRVNSKFLMLLHIPFCMPFNLVGSYFALQWLTNVLATSTSLAANCNSSQTVSTVVGSFHLCVAFGLSILGTNLLCHRYLCEKARIMIKLCVGREFPSHPIPKPIPSRPNNPCIIS
jgi:hypothetical protein